MSLATGTKLGPYEILSPLGVGGPPSLALPSDGVATRLR